MPSPRHLPLNRRLTTLLLSVLALITVFSLLLSFSSGHQESGPISSHPSTAGGASHINVNPETLKGGVISSKIGNETLKAELGRAAWKLLHTTMAKFPDKPNEDEQTALLSYIHLFARLYPWQAPLYSLLAPKRLSLPITPSSVPCSCPPFTPLSLRTVSNRLTWTAPTSQRRMCLPFPNHPLTLPTPSQHPLHSCRMGLPRPQRSQPLTEERGIRLLENRRFL